jgi:hypothetical protein
LDEILSVLSTTRWDEEITEDIRSRRDQLYTLLHITKQTIVLEEASESYRLRSADEMDYKGTVNPIRIANNSLELVKEMGY